MHNDNKIGIGCDPMTTNVFPLSCSRLFEMIDVTVRTYPIFSEVKRKDPKDNWFKIAIQSKGIILNYQISDLPEQSKLLLSAYSPFCIISDSYQQLFISLFLYHLDIVISSESKKRNIPLRKQAYNL